MIVNQNMDGYWYVVQIYTGHEKKVKLSLDNMIAREELQDEILQVNVPETEVVEVKDSQRKVSIRPSYPGYVLINTTHELGPDVDMSLLIPRMNWVQMLIVRLDRKVGDSYKRPRAL
jgi:transcription antitermination factor NusG